MVTGDYERWKLDHYLTEGLRLFDEESISTSYFQRLRLWFFRERKCLDWGRNVLRVSIVPHQLIPLRVAVSVLHLRQQRKLSVWTKLKVVLKNSCTWTVINEREANNYLKVKKKVSQESIECAVYFIDV